MHKFRLQHIKHQQRVHLHKKALALNQIQVRYRNQIQVRYIVTRIKYA